MSSVLSRRSPGFVHPLHEAEEKRKEKKRKEKDEKRNGKEAEGKETEEKEERGKRREQGFGFWVLGFGDERLKSV